MPKITKPLTDTEIRKSKPKEKQYKISDGAGLCLIITPLGTKYFRFDYTYNKKRKSLSFGKFPKTSLKDARKMREDAKDLLDKYIDPSQKRKIDKKIDTFEDISQKWLDMNKDRWAVVTYKKAKETIRANTKSIKDKNMKHISRIDILDIVAVMQKRDVHVLANRLLGYFNSIWMYAVSYDIVERNIIADIDRRHAIKQKEKSHFPAITDNKNIKRLMFDIFEYKNLKQADISSIYAFKLSPYLFLRPYNLRTLLWSEVDLENDIIEIEASRMKTRKDFIIPFSRQTKKILIEIKSYSYNISDFVFPSPVTTKQPISENTLNMALKRMGYKDVHTPHGFRAMFSTVTHENIDKHGYHSDIIELCLAHEQRNQIKAAYNRDSKTKYIKERKNLIQWYCDFIDNL